MFSLQSHFKKSIMGLQAGSVVLAAKPEALNVHGRRKNQLSDLYMHTVGTHEHTFSGSHLKSHLL